MDRFDIWLQAKRENCRGKLEFVLLFDLLGFYRPDYCRGRADSDQQISADNAFRADALSALPQEAPNPRQGPSQQPKKLQKGKTALLYRRLL